MAVLSVVAVSRAGNNLTTGAQAAAVGGDSFANTGKEFLYVDNQHSAAQTVTLTIQKVIDGQAFTNHRTVSVPAGQRMLIGPFSTADYNDTNGRVAVTYSGVTALTVMAIQLIPII